MARSKAINCVLIAVALAASSCKEKPIRDCVDQALFDYDTVSSKDRDFKLLIALKRRLNACPPTSLDPARNDRELRIRGAKLVYYGAETQGHDATILLLPDDSRCTEFLKTGTAESLEFESVMCGEREVKIKPVKR